jgi:DNA-binding NarL/FixJ family response regulator
VDKIRVLIVDDHRVFAEALTLAMATESDIEILGDPVLNGGDAASAVVERQADVVLMDLNLPDKDGIEATREVKQARPDTKVVILSADPPEPRLAEAAEAGASGYLTKTRAVADVADSVRRAHVGEILIPGDVLARVLTRMAQERSKRAQAEHMASMLTPRELEVLALLAEGLSNRMIARRLVVSPRTADTHVHNLLTKLGAHSKLEAVVTGIKWGLVDVRRGA